MTIDSDVKKIVLNIIMAHGYPASEGWEENPIPNIEERNHECFIVSSKNDNCISNNKK